MKITIGNMIDQLSIINIKIWMAEDQKRNGDATDADIAKATKITNIANQQRNNLIQSIDEELNNMVETGELQKLYGQGSTKMYGKE
jgi:hypothetical protein